MDTWKGLKSGFAMVSLSILVAWLHTLSFTIPLTDPLSIEWVGEGKKLAWSPEVLHCGGCSMTQLCHEQQVPQREVAWSLARAGETPHGLRVLEALTAAGSSLLAVIILGAYGVAKAKGRACLSIEKVILGRFLPIKYMTVIWYVLVAGIILVGNKGLIL